MKFTKMHGIGNDYVYVNTFEESLINAPELATVISDRHTGVGSDGLILIGPSEVADVKMVMFNADGSQAEMCGNGVRCVARYSFDHGLSTNNPMTIETGRGVLTLALDIVDEAVESITVDMGEPVLELADIPVDVDKLENSSANASAADRIPKHVYKLRLPRPEAKSGGSEGSAETLLATFVSMGNPHVVIFVDDVSKIDLADVGPLIENHPAFPRRINAHFVQVVSPGELIMSTWERGSGITRACGTGACAVAVAAVLTGRCDRQTLIHLPGGDLMLQWQESDNHVYMTGPATEVFTGEWPDAET